MHIFITHQSGEKQEYYEIRLMLNANAFIFHMYAPIIREHNDYHIFLFRNRILKRFCKTLPTFVPLAAFVCPILSSQV